MPQAISPEPIQPQGNQEDLTGKAGPHQEEDEEERVKRTLRVLLDLAVRQFGGSMMEQELSKRQSWVSHPISPASVITRFGDDRELRRGNA